MHRLAGRAPLDATDGGQHSAVTVRGWTIVFSGPGEAGVNAAAASSSDAHATLFNTLVRAPAAGVPDLRAATVNSGVTASSSAFSDSAGATPAPGSAPTSRPTR